MDFGALAYETFDVEVSGTFMADLFNAGEPLRDLDGNPIPELQTSDNGWNESPDWVKYREELNGQFAWMGSGSEKSISDQETMTRKAVLKLRRWEVEQLDASMRVLRRCDGKYYDITAYQDDPGAGLYIKVYLEKVKD